MNDNSHYPRFSVRESKRARRVSLKISMKDGLEVVIPCGFDRNCIPRIIREKEEWIRRTFEKLNNAKEPASPQLVLPESIHLKAVDRRFAVRYVNQDLGVVHLRQEDSSSIGITGNTGDLGTCRSLLKWWLQQKGRLHLVPWLQQVSDRTGLGYDRVQIRGQRSRWGSCSTRGTISLNCKLLFLSADLVEYILIHELCHTRQPDHSANYWSLVAEFKPDYRVLDERMKLAVREVPLWAK